MKSYKMNAEVLCVQFYKISKLGSPEYLVVLKNEYERTFVVKTKTNGGINFRMMNAINKKVTVTLKAGKYIDTLINFVEL